MQRDELERTRLTRWLVGIRVGQQSRRRACVSMLLWRSTNDAVLDQHVRGHDEADLLDLAEPFLVGVEFGGNVRHSIQ